jgi:hypothetical protein
MNFISEMEGQEMQVELKYCERCGGLWLRPQGTDGVYCSSCHVWLAAMPDPGEPTPSKARRRRRARVQELRAEEQGTAVREEAQKDVQEGELQNPGQIDYLQGVCAMEVSA